jgi:hypothetical protein
MTPTDPEQERQQLAASYSKMSDAQLEELAADPVALTDLAHTALKDEIQRRGLDIDLEDAPPTPDEIEEGELVTIRRFRDLPEALLAKGLLESAGIECFLLDDNMVRLDWFISNALGNMRLQVNKNDSDTAMEILDQSAPDDVEDSE